MTHLVHASLFAPGDRLCREEFLKLWEQMPELKFAELIDGVVHMPSPLSLEHGERDHETHGWVHDYEARTPICRAGANATWLMLEDAPQPDLALRIFPEFGGRATLSGVLNEGVPELIVEVCRTSQAYDLGPKLRLYERAGVEEYVAFVIDKKRVEWRVLEDGKYRLLKPDQDGILRSRVFPGLWLDAAAYWRYDLSRLREVLEQGVASEEHAAFLKDRMRK